MTLTPPLDEQSVIVVAAEIATWPEMAEVPWPRCREMAESMVRQYERQRYLTAVREVARLYAQYSEDARQAAEERKHHHATAHRP